MNPILIFETNKMSGKHCQTCRCNPKCKFCGAQWDEDDGYHVEVRTCQTESCKAKLCLYCKIYCDQCYKHYCQDCQIPCESCQINICPNCISECTACCYFFCSDCGDKCSNCSKVICKDCIKSGNHSCLPITNQQ